MNRIATLLIATALSLPVCTQSSNTSSPARLDYSKPFELKDEIPNLYNAASLPPEEGVRQLFQNNVHLRTYVAIALQRQCGSETQDRTCRAKLGDEVLETQITSLIDDLVNKRIHSGGSITSVDYAFNRPWPFAAVTAMRPHSESKAYLVLGLFPGNFYTVSRILEQYGDPNDQRISGSPRSLSYRTTAKNYVFVIRFQLNQGETEAEQIWLTLTKQN